MKTQTSTFSFTGKAGHPQNAVALLYDLEGFSQFFNQPDVQDYVPAFLNHVSAAVGVCLFGGTEYWTDNLKLGPLQVQVAHEKFTGDGALYILLPAPGDSDFPTSTLPNLCNRLWNLKQHFGNVVKKSLEEVPVVQVPRHIRFGLSRGSVYELRKPGTSATEYIGFCLNLASRLQKYCRELGFIASARLMLPDEVIAAHDYIKVVATQISGFSNEIVLVDKDEYQALSEERRSALFKEPE
jgi:class 3 adenylate cyclase